MAIKIEDVDKIAKLAKLEFAPVEKKKLAKQMAQIVSYFEKLSQLETNDIPPTYHVLDIENVMREDRTEPWLTQEQALANAPAKKMGYFSVPKVIGEKQEKKK